MVYRRRAFHTGRMFFRLSQFLDLARHPRIASFLLLAVCILYAPTDSELSAEAARSRTAAEFQRFFESRVPQKLRENGVAGAIVAIVDRDRALYTAGFGCARYPDSGVCTRVDPERTLFRAASISKLYTFTALMQLIQAGRVDLDADVNLYVERREPQSGEILFRVPDAFGQAVRVRDLFSHTPGFEDRAINLFTADPKITQSVREAIETLPPDRVRAPGEQIAYSNYGATLAGYIVERVSGQSFEDYVADQIFAPLGMRRATFRQPLPVDFAEQMSDGFIYSGPLQADATGDAAQDQDDAAVQEAREASAGDAQGGGASLDPAQFEPQVFEIIQGTPAGGLTITAGDMGRFLSAHLRARDAGGLLDAATARRMHSTLFRPHASANTNGFAHGFMELSSHGQRIVGHGGDTIFFHSLAGIFPEQNLGFFIATNSMTGMLPVWELREEFLNEFFPAPTGAELINQDTASGGEAQQSSANDLDRYPGYFITNRRSEKELTKISSLFMAIDVHRNQSGDGLLIRDFFTGDLLDCVEVEENVFQARDGHKRFLFLENDAGEIESLLSNEIAVMTFNRAVWYEWPPLHFGILGLGLVLILGGFIFRPTGLRMALSRGYRGSLDLDARRAGWLGFGIVVSYVLYLGVFAYFSSSIEFIFEIPPRWPFYIPFAAFLFQLAALTYVLPAWSRGYWNKAGRVFFTTLVLGLFPLFWFLYYWNLIA